MMSKPAIVVLKATIACLAIVAVPKASQSQFITGLGVGASIDVETIEPLRIRGRGAGEESGDGPPGRPQDVRRGTVFVYSVKYLCGTVPGPFPPLKLEGPDEPPFPDTSEIIPHMMMHGHYLTAINIHNPQRTTVTFAKKAVQTPPQRTGPRPTREPVDETLPADWAIEVDCGDIEDLLGGGFILGAVLYQGFVVIESPVELQVVAVHIYKNIEGANGNGIENGQ